MMGSNQFSSRRYLDYEDPEIHEPIYLNKFNREVRDPVTEALSNVFEKQKPQKLVTSYRQDKFQANKHTIRKIGVDLSEFVKDARRDRVYVMKRGFDESQDEDDVDRNFDYIQAISVDEEEADCKGLSSRGIAN